MKALSLIFTILLLSITLAGCATNREVREVDKDFEILRVGNSAQYVIDTRAEACFLLFLGSDSPVAVNCANLKKNIPEAKNIITW